MTDGSSASPRRLEIAMIGQRGVPATHGGIERHVEEVGSRLVDRGHRVVVYCRPNYVADRPASHRGMELRHLPTLGTRHLDAAVHSAASTASAMREQFDVVHFHAIGPGALAILPRVAGGGRVVQTIHGLDHRRAKWGRLTRSALGGAAWLSEWVPDAVVGVSRDVTDHYRGRRVPAVHIPNGVPEPRAQSSDALRRYALDSRPYVLFVGRLVPEKGAHVLLDAFSRLPDDHDVDLVFAGGSSFTDAYEAELCALAARDARVRLLGYVYGADLDALYGNAAAFVTPSLLEGLPLTLLEAVTHAVPVLASDIGPHREVLVDDGPGRRLVPAGDAAALAEELARVQIGPASERRAGAGTAADVARRYSWDAAAGALDALYQNLVADRPVPEGSTLYERCLTAQARAAA